MINLYFKKPKYDAIIKINNVLIKEFPYKILLENSLFIEFLPVNPVYLPFFAKIYYQNGVVYCTNNLKFYTYNNNNILIDYLPNYVALPLHNIGTINTDFTYDLLSLVRHFLLIKKDNKITKIIKLNNDIYNPKISLVNGYIILQANGLNRQYLLVLDSNNNCIINGFYNGIQFNNTNIVLTINYNDLLGRTAIFTYDNKNFILDNLTFTYKKSSSNLPLLFLEAYSCKDYKKIREITYFEIDYASLYSYLGSFEILQQIDNDIYILKDDKICKITFVINNDKITNFQLFNINN